MRSTPALFTVCAALAAPAAAIADPTAGPRLDIPEPIPFSEVLISTPGADAEYIEIRNTTPFPVPLGGYRIELWDSDAGPQFGLPDAGSPYVIPAGVVIPPGGRYLLANAQAVAVYGLTPNQMLPADALENGSFTMIFVEEPNDTIMDAVFVSDGGPNDRPNRGGAPISLVPQVGPDNGSLLPAGFYLAEGPIADYAFLEFANPAPSATPGVQNPEIDPANDWWWAIDNYVATVIPTGPNAVPLPGGAWPINVAGQSLLLANFVASHDPIERAGGANYAQFRTYNDTASVAWTVAGRADVLDAATMSPVGIFRVRGPLAENGPILSYNAAIGEIVSSTATPADGVPTPFRLEIFGSQDVITGFVVINNDNRKNVKKQSDIRWDFTFLPDPQVPEISFTLPPALGGQTYFGTLAGGGSFNVRNPVGPDCPGDVNGDLLVDFRDLSEVLSFFGAQPCQ